MEHFRNAVYAILIPLPLGLFLAMHPPYFAQLQICVSAWPHPYSVAGKNPVVKKRSGRNTLIPLLFAWRKHFYSYSMRKGIYFYTTRAREVTQGF
jgi:hypothetical protein